MNSNKILESQNKISSKKKSTMKKIKTKNISQTIKNSGDEKIIERNDYELNSLNYENAKKFDQRTFCQYYLSLIRLKQLLIFTFYTKTDYNSRLIKINSFFTSFILNYAIKALFFNDSVMHVIYINNGVYDILYQLPQILYSTIFSIFIGFLLSILSMTQKNVIELKEIKFEMNDYQRQINNILNVIKIKFIFFHIMDFLLLFIFWFYLSCFCAVYKNTQIYLIKDVLLSFGMSFIYPFFISLVPSILRKCALYSEKKCLFSFSKIIQLM